MAGAEVDLDHLSTHQGPPLPSQRAHLIRGIDVGTFLHVPPGSVKIESPFLMAKSPFLVG